MSRRIRLALVALFGGWALGAELLYRTLRNNHLAHPALDAVGGWLAVAVAGAFLLVLVTWRPEGDTRARDILRTLTESLQSIDLVTEPSLDRLPLEDVLEIMLQRVSQALAADAAVIYVLSDDEQALTLQAATGFEGSEAAAIDIPLGAGIVGKVAASGQLIAANDIRASDVYSPFLKERLASIVATPLTVDGRLIGVLAVGTTSRRHFRDTDLRLLRLASDRMSVGIERARLYEAQRRARLSAVGAQNQMSVLAGAGEVLAGALDDYNPSLQALGRVLVPGYADWFAVHLAEADRTLGPVDRAWGGRVGDDRRTGNPRQVAGWDALAERVVSERRSTLVFSDAESVSEEDRRLIEENGFQSLMAVPVRVRGLSFGVLGFATFPERRGYRPSDLRTAEGLAQRVAAAVERVLLYREARDAERTALANAAQLRRLMAAALTVNRPLSETQILDVVAEQARGVGQAGRAVVAVAKAGEAVRAFSPTESRAAPIESLEQLVMRTGRSARGGTGEPLEGRPLLSPQAAALPDTPWLVAPLTDVAGNPIGSIVLIGAERGSFSPEDEAILVSIAQMASVALGNARLYEEVQANGQRLQTLMESSPLGIVELDLDAGARWWNPAASSLFGWADPDDLGPGAPRPDLSSVLSPELTSELSRLWYRAVRGQTTVGMEFSLERTGTVRHLSVSTAPMRSDDGSVTGIMALVEEVTERRRLEDQFHQAERLEAMGRLAGGVAHDFNNLVSVILGYSEMLLRREQETTVRESIEAIARAGRRAAALTGQLLAVGRREVGRPTVVDPTVVVHDMEQMVLSLLGADIKARFRFNADGARVLIDRSQLERAVLNLVINARDAMPHGGRLTVRVGTVDLDIDEVAGSSMPGPYVEVEVADTGQGMDADTVEHCFEPFFTTKDRTKGTGLGLAAVHGVVTNAGGAVTVRSRVGRGTSFILRLPEVAADLHVEDEMGPRPARRGSATILLVEDQAELRSLAGTSLESHGYRIVPAADAQEALQLAEQMGGAIDLLLTDVIMPGMSGPELARKLLESHPDVPVLFISGYTGDDKLAEGRLPAGADLLPKPFGPEELRQRVEDALDRAEMHRSADLPARTA
jgi:PAS domain S-box-containing protein